MSCEVRCAINDAAKPTGRRSEAEVNLPDSKLVLDENGSRVSDFR